MTFERREIGSEFWDVPVMCGNNKIFPINTKWFISGTAALECIIADMLQHYTIKTVALPSWCCNSMIVPFLNSEISIVFYPVYYENERLICNYSGISADCWLTISYFGYSSQTDIGIPSGVIIRDLTHSLFTEIQTDADYYFGSLRKWAGFVTGGFAWKKSQWLSNKPLSPVSEEYIKMRRNAMEWKKRYLDGSENNKGYLELFSQAEDYLDSCGIESALEQDVYDATHFDVSFIKRRRNKNAAFLLRYISDYALFKDVDEQDCPLFVPILLNNKKRNQLRQYLIDNSIYCPVHWPISKEHVLSKDTKVLFDSSLSIVCDQRYTISDMKQIIKVLRDFGLCLKEVDYE